MKTRTALILLALLATVTVSCANRAGHKAKREEQLYPLTARVVDINRITDDVTIETATGYQFRFEGCEDWQYGDLASCIMNDKGTEIITDDEIVSVRYSGYNAE